MICWRLAVIASRSCRSFFCSLAISTIVRCISIGGSGISTSSSIALVIEGIEVPTAFELSSIKVDGIFKYQFMYSGSAMLSFVIRITRKDEDATHFSLFLVKMAQKFFVPLAAKSKSPTLK